jgi:hypothetical protein
MNVLAYSKAIAAVVAVVATMIGREFSPAESQAIVDFLMGILTVALVYFVPNKKTE